MESFSVKDIVSAVDGKLLCGDEKTMVTNICIDSRDAGDGSLFVPIIGERVDAHKFIGQVFENGAAAVLTSRDEIVTENKPHILVENTEKALGALAVWYKKRFNIPVIGITGSVGKTSTKEMIAAALSPVYNVLKTAGNQNSNIGVPLTLFRLESGHEIAVIEMGISDFDEMAELADFVCPDTAVVTNIGVAHLAQFKSRENIMAEKLQIARHFGNSNTLYVNLDNDMLQTVANKTWSDERLEFLRDKHILSFSADGGAADFRAENIHIKDGRQCFDFVCDDDKTEVCLLQLGLHSVSNALVALAIAMQYGVSLKEAKAGVESYEGIAMRQQVNHLSRGIKVIDDTYNASPDSIKSGAQVLVSIDNTGRKILSLADVLELGETAWDCHYETGLAIAKLPIDEIIAVGPMMKALIQAVNECAPHIVTTHFDDNASAAEYINRYFSQMAMHCCARAQEVCIRKKSLQPSVKSGHKIYSKMSVYAV